MTPSEIIKEKEFIIGQIKQYLPSFAKFFDMAMPVKEYSRNLYDFEILPIHKTRQKLITSKISMKLQQLYGKDAEKKFSVNFSGPLAFNIVDHHMVLNHPLLVGSNVISSVDNFFKDKKSDAIIVISSGDVPPNNYFGKSGFQFHGKQVPLFSVSERESTSYYLPKREFNFFQRLKISKRLKEFSGDELAFLENLQEEFNQMDFSRAKNYNDQISLIVRKTWPWLFEKKLRPNLPELLYITQEELIALCLKEILEDDNFISAALFNEQFRQKVLDTFRGIVVTWRESEGKGTHFFWRKHPQKHQGLRMFLVGGKLVPSDERYKDLAIDFEKNTILELLEKKEIYPSLFLIFSALNFYAGIKPLAGYGSVIYLEKFQQRWSECLKDSPYEHERANVESIDTSGFVGGVPIFFKRIEGKIKTLYAADIFEFEGISENYLQTIFDIPFNQFLDVSVADLYNYFSQKYIPANKRIKPKINFDDVGQISLNWL